MAQTYLNVRSHGVLTVRLDPTAVRGDGSVARPVLRLPLELQILSIEGKEQIIDYTLLCMAGVLRMKGMETLAEFDAGPMSEDSTPRPFFRQLSIEVPLDLPRIRKFEEARSGADAFLSIGLSGLVWFPKETKFEKVTSQSDLQFSVPRSTWADQVLPAWGLSSVRVIEIAFPKSEAGDNFRAAYLHVDAAEKLFANGQYKQVLAELYSCFEGLAKSMNLGKPDQQFFAQLLAELHPTKKESAKRALDNLCDFLHLGRHEAKEAPEAFGISRSEARFALIMSQAVLEYITPRG